MSWAKKVIYLLLRISRFQCPCMYSAKEHKKGTIYSKIKACLFHLGKENGNRYWISFWNPKNVLLLDSDNGHITIWKSTELHN